jgi:AraC family transcriptional activator of pobA
MGADDKPVAEPRRVTLPSKIWHYTDMATIPHFQLYGEQESLADPGFVHIETIASRSSLNDWEIRPHSHEMLDQLLVIRAGSAVARIEGKTVELEGPAVIHVPACTVHGFRFEDGTLGDVLTFSAELRGSLMASQVGRPVLVDRPVARAIDPLSATMITPLLTQLHVECFGHAQGRIAASAWLVGLLLLQVGRWVGDEAGARVEDSRLTLFRRLVDQHFREHRPVAFYADALTVTERSLTRLTQARLGCAPVQYLHRRLLLEARRQLAYGSQTVARIAEELGFADPSYFTRFYRRMTGELPSAVRRAL